MTKSELQQHVSDWKDCDSHRSGVQSTPDSGARGWEDAGPDWGRDVSGSAGKVCLFVFYDNVELFIDM